MSEKNICVSVYPTYQAVEAALGNLQKEGIDFHQVSVVGKGYHDEAHPIGFHTMEDRIAYLGLQGAFWGGLWDLLEGAAFLWVPGFGPLTAAGTIVTLLVKGLEDVGIGGGFGVLGAALYDLGVPGSNISEYEQAVRNEMFLLMVNGTRGEVEQACSLLLSETQQVAVHTA